MVKQSKTLRTCDQGHQYYKSSDCPVCPLCEQQRAVTEDFLAAIAAPARRALENQGITTLRKLASFSEKEILSLHGMGPGSIPKLKQKLEEKGLAFRK
ncbi:MULTISPECIES: DNA-directed RNA polymerase subunit alpha C-terminal domain-containing protein [Olivibacter]|jgi:predicted RecB family nuclease|uniref:DNA-directed RNA polymerase subunit alpha C-terminal domain-containing protein n=2 Tax=Olivibacter TaxID=376469 RepID=A0ABV6HQC7_9SPHI|nr:MULTISPECIES: DNA-directed RNA polymerase subunit alpha C-terminal domain-containing protein [Olivibacter]MCL4638473.1 hypothetical protein [Olivibacter sp. UJ_SKK_5.1]MDM8174048.1 DNA-directed RNA polymerase subunit alpha C-terminal domain-containing protein [Olivibacter sp. 47]MDX3917167.1 DNA-directed RNA polymerase subunit alpha C-terminal domain-containing protein [Pseudosphingobacterium sp.]QEL03833.1 hypothetical protein FKG96_24385 [Olivibacter sp. LS-1]